MTTTYPELAPNQPMIFKTPFLKASLAIGKMPQPNDILVFIAALVLLVSAQPLPPNVGQGSFVYDPDSIPQNEQILRLFLHLASHTANRLIYLKKEAKPQLSSTQGSNGNYSGHPGYYDQNQGPYIPGVPDEVLSPKNETSSELYPPDKENNEQHLFNESTNLNVSSFKSQDKLEKLSENVENSTNTPVDIENRMLFKLEKNNSVTQYKNISRNTNKAVTKINNIASPNQRGTDIPQSGSVIVNQNTDPSGFHGYNTNQATIDVNSIGSSKEIESAASSVPSRSSKSAERTNSTNSDLQSVSSGVESSAQGAKSMFGNAGGLGIARQAMSSITNLQSRIKNTAQGLATGLQNATGKISRQAKTAASKLHSMSSGISTSAEGVASRAQSTETGVEMSHKALTGASHVQSGIMDQLSGVQEAGSEVLIGTINTAKNLTNQTMTGHAANEHHEGSGKRGLFGLLDPKKAVGILLNANAKPNVLMDLAMSGVKNIGSGVKSKVTETIQNSGSKVVQGIGKHITSIQESTGGIGKSLERSNSGVSKITGTLVVEGGSGAKTAFETSIQRGRAPSVAIKSGADGVSQIGTSLTAPLFRSFPDVYDQSSMLKKSVFDTTRSKKNQTEVNDSQTSIKQQNGDNKGIFTTENKTTPAPINLKSTNTSNQLRSPFSFDKLGIDDDFQNRLSELIINEYASQFAYALRPVEFIRKKTR